MRDPKRIKKILKLIEKIWLANPDLRLAQLILNCDVIYQTPDEILVEALREVYDTQDKTSK